LLKASGTHLLRRNLMVFCQRVGRFSDAISSVCIDCFRRHPPHSMNLTKQIATDKSLSLKIFNYSPRSAAFSSAALLELLLPPVM
jgi:hypothetical protein